MSRYGSQSVPTRRNTKTSAGGVVEAIVITFGHRRLGATLATVPMRLAHSPGLSPSRDATAGGPAHNRSPGPPQATFWT